MALFTLILVVVFVCLVPGLYRSDGKKPTNPLIPIGVLIAALYTANNTPPPNYEGSLFWVITGVTAALVCGSGFLLIRKDKVIANRWARGGAISALMVLALTAFAYTWFPFNEDPELTAKRAEKARQLAELEQQQLADRAEIEAKEAAKAKAAKAAEKAACMKSREAALQCDSDGGSRYLCSLAVERLAKFDFEWQSRVRFDRPPIWLSNDPKDWRIRWRGNRIKFQNAFGTWVPVSYQCDFDLKAGVPVAVEAR